MPTNTYMFIVGKKKKKIVKLSVISRCSFKKKIIPFLNYLASMSRVKWKLKVMVLD